MNLLIWILAFGALSSVLSVAAAGIYLLLPAQLRAKTLTHLVSFATGVLLGTAFLHLLPEALKFESGPSPEHIMMMALAAIIAFFLLEKGLIWRHSHHTHEDTENSPEAGDQQTPTGSLILIGDSVHNFIDGVLITAAFITNFELGVITALAIITHEIPQELSDFAILINSGMARSKAFMLNLLSSLAMLVGIVLAWLAFDVLTTALPYLLAFTAASFIYIAVADLMPALNKQIKLSSTAMQLLLMMLGLMISFFFKNG